MLKKFASFIPRPLVCGLRGAYILLRQRGQTKRDLLGNCVDSEGNPIPWMTYPAIDFLGSYNLSSCAVFEFGSGASTFFWSKNCRSVISVEHFPPWYEKMRSHAHGNITLIPQFDLPSYPAEIHGYGNFDVIVIDGAERMGCVKACLEHISPVGIVVLDNSEWYPNCCAVLRAHGFTQLDFCGFTPLNSFTAMTSVFIQGKIAFPYKPKRQFWTPIGGKPLNYSPPDDTL